MSGRYKTVKISGLRPYIIVIQPSLEKN